MRGAPLKDLIMKKIIIMAVSLLFSSSLFAHQGTAPLGAAGTNVPARTVSSALTQAEINADPDNTYYRLSQNIACEGKFTKVVKLWVTNKNIHYDICRNGMDPVAVQFEESSETLYFVFNDITGGNTATVTQRIVSVNPPLGLMQDAAYKGNRWFIKSDGL